MEGKQIKAYLNLNFPLDFPSLSANPKHYSNTSESMKLVKEVTIPYIEKERISLKLPKTIPALLIMDVFRGQMTEDILTILKGNNIVLVRVPANMTYIFQLLDGEWNIQKLYAQNVFQVVQETDLTRLRKRM